jgi:1-acyl-sn-glycerol-3-phosphate acyltransferase
VGIVDRRPWRAAARVGLFVWRCVTVAREMAAEADGLGVDRSDQQARRVQDLARQLCKDHGIHVVVEGHAPDFPAVFVANHVSHVDPLVIATVRPLLPIAKGEISRWPFIGRVGCYLGIMFVKRDSVMSGASVLRRSLRVLQQGVSVLNFPEGTTTFGNEVLPFRRGIFGAAAKAGVPVIPTALRFEPQGIAWVGDAYFVPHCLRAFARSHWTAYVSFGKALRVNQQTPAEEMAELSRLKIVRLLANRSCAQQSSPVDPDSPRTATQSIESNVTG